MNPLTVNPLVILGGAALVGALGFGAGWTTNGWRLKADIAEIKTANAEAISQASQVALSDYQDAAKSIKDAAAGAQVDLSNVSAQLVAIRRNQKNAPPPPLPADCRPGAQRLHNLSETAAAADRAISRPVPGK